MVRFKNRYFTVEVISLDSRSSSQPLALKKYEIIQTLLSTTEEIHGEFGAAAIRNGLDVKYLDEKNRIIIIRSRHGPHRLLASSLPFLSKIGKRKIQLQGVYTGASMVQCFKHLKKYHQEKLNEALNLATEKKKATTTSNINFEET
uniref:Ribonuclease P/MRP protein subunit POP5 n=1 Tax=Simocephalus serrulatus TaxID=117539 RepID=A0A4Y7NPL1_9CRUS|nr:EOG090X0GYO [Simocephalus serrulatus]SVE94587.1 EOG090X0GYO [Simocephalus serrulatus]